MSCFYLEFNFLIKRVSILCFFYLITFPVFAVEKNSKEITEEIEVHSSKTNLSTASITKASQSKNSSSKNLNSQNVNSQNVNSQKKPLIIESQVKGSQEQPNVIYIMPWQGIAEPIMIEGNKQKIALPNFKPINPKTFKKQAALFYSVNTKNK
jgi:hypothetical protein